MAVLAKATQAMDLIARAHGPVRLSEAATSLGLPKSSTHRLLNELVEHDLLRREEDGRFRLGIRLLSWGQAVEQSYDIRGLALAHMETLSAETGETVNLHVPQGDHRVCLASTRGTDVLLPPVAVGSAVPLGVGATGTVLLAFSPEPLVEQVCEELAAGGYAVPSADDLSRVRAAQWATSRNDQEVGLAAGATVIIGPGGRVLAALSVGGDAEHLPEGRLEELRPAMLAAALRISEQLIGHGA